jgi:predicted transcriptional regulator with HTH domain
MNIDTEIVGNKYNQVKDLDITDIAKLIRQDLKKFKDCKFSVSIKRYSGGKSLNVKLVECSNLNRFKIFKSEYCDSRAVFIDEFDAELKSIINQYNFDRSNPQSDYFHVNFYEHLYIDRDLEIKINEQLKIAA